MRTVRGPGRRLVQIAAAGGCRKPVRV